MRPDCMPRPWPTDEPPVRVGTVSQVDWEDSDRIVLRIEKDDGDITMWENVMVGTRVRLVTDAEAK